MPILNGALTLKLTYMKNFTLLFSALLLTAFSWQANAQGDCFSSGTYDYNDNEDFTNAVGFIANTPGDYITLTFTGGITESCCDTWFIMDAADGTGNVIATGAGSIVGTYESTTGEISFFVDSDGSWSPVSGGGTAGTTWDTFVYSLSCSPPPACVPPSSLTASNITSSSADLVWTENGTATAWDLEYGAAPFTPTGTPTMTGVTNPYNYSGLTANTAYEFYVRADCGGDQSNWVGPYSFTTLCPSSFTPGYLEDFTTWIPGCWDEADNGTPSTAPTGAGAGEWNHSDYLNNGGANDAAKINLWNTGTSDWLLSPNFDMSAGGPWELVINAGVTTFNGTGSIAMGSDDSVQVVISTDGGLTWGAIYTWDVNNSPSNGGSPYVIDLSAYTSTTNLFGIWASEGTVDDAEDFDFHIGSFEIRTPPLCAEPSALTVSNITSSSADLDWTAGGTETMWDLEYGAAPFTPTGTPTMTGVTNPFNYSGLTANTAYEFYVRADCGGSQSAWVGPYSFNTTCNTAAITYTQDFTTWPMQCWDLTGGSQSWSDNGSGIALANFWYWPNPTDAIMSTEPINISVDARVRFDWSHLYSATYPLDSLSVDVKVLPGGTWTSIWGKGGSDLESNDGAGNTTPGSMVTETILLDAGLYTGQDVQVRFVATSGYGPDLFVDNLIIEALPPCDLTATAVATDETTTGANDGTATVAADLGTAPYTYLWDDALTQTTATATGLEPGTYTATVTDANGCVANATATVNAATACDLTATAVATDETTAGANDGTATVAADLGTAPYTYLWDDALTQTTATATGLEPGTYTATVTDANGCVANATATVNAATACDLTATAVATDETTAGANDGTATVAADLGTAPYTYLWDDALTQTTATATGLEPGTYTATVTDANGCVANATATVNAATACDLTATAVATDETTAGANDGTATVAADLGTAPYTYLWDDALTQTTATATGLEPGTYTATVTDANGCVANATATVNAATACDLTATAVATDETTTGANDGTATVAADLGTAPYTYLWDDALTQTTATATGLEPGTYTATVTDANGCVANATATVNAATACDLTATAVATDETTTGANDGTATVAADLGTAPYTYLWDDALTQTTATATGLEPGTYTATVTDANGCVANATATVNAAPNSIVDNADNSAFEIYPNPNSGTFSVKLRNDNSRIVIRNVIGQVVFSKTVNSTIETIQLNDVNSGVYFITSGNVTKRFIVQ